MCVELIMGRTQPAVHHVKKIWRNLSQPGQRWEKEEEIPRRSRIPSNGREMLGEKKAVGQESWHYYTTDGFQYHDGLGLRQGAHRGGRSGRMPNAGYPGA